MTIPLHLLVCLRLFRMHVTLRNKMRLNLKSGCVAELGQMG